MIEKVSLHLTIPAATEPERGPPLSKLQLSGLCEVSVRQD